MKEVCGYNVRKKTHYKEKAKVLFAGHFTSEANKDEIRNAEGKQ